MNSLAAWAGAWNLLGALVLQVSLVVGTAALLQCRVESSPLRRNLWQICTLGLVLLVLYQLFRLCQKRLSTLAEPTG